MTGKEQFLSIATDFKGGKGVPQKRLYQIASAGFSHILWCHEMGKSDHFYTPDEITQAQKNLRDTGLLLLDLHAPDGKTLNWTSSDQTLSQGGILLMRNRLKMTAKLGGKVMMAHWYADPMANPETASNYWDTTRRNLDEITKTVRETGVMLALENLYGADNFPYLKQLFALYPPEELGLCYDSGHGNITKTGIDYLQTTLDRLISIHISDNFGINKRFPQHSDTHRLPFDGDIHWAVLTSLLAKSAYKGPINLELVKRPYPDIPIQTYLADAFKRGSSLDQMVKNQENNELALA